VTQAGSILIVDDNRLDQQLLAAYLAESSYALEFARDGVEAMALLEHDPLRYDAVLLDRSMPRMDGLEVLVRIKEQPRLRMLPVILQTAAAGAEEVRQGMRAGAFYYLSKPYDAETLLAVLRTAVRDYGEYKELQKQVRRGMECVTLIDSATLRLRTVDQARDAAALFVNACPDPESVVIGLTELLVNAVEHGNLGITYDEKSALNAAGDWDAEVRRRLALPENADKRVELRMERDEREIRFTIRDGGPGFPWQKYLEVQPQRAYDNHGRGIAIARAMSFDRVEYRGNGNEVMAVVRLR
jgi:CheY-like chemotaxis protein/anti-sigma regulatory factor (Ser/Thr protein kinase)